MVSMSARVAEQAVDESGITPQGFLHRSVVACTNCCSDLNLGFSLSSQRTTSSKNSSLTVVVVTPMEGLLDLQLRFLNHGHSRRRT